MVKTNNRLKNRRINRLKKINQVFIIFFKQSNNYLYSNLEKSEVTVENQNIVSYIINDSASD
jgi:hypothetical protein